MVRKHWIMTGLCLAAAAMLCSLSFGEKGKKKCSLPAAIESAVKTLFPNAEIEKSKTEEEGIKMSILFGTKVAV